MVIAIVLFWALLGVGVFFIAMRGGPKGARQALHTDSPAGRRLVGLGIVVLFAAGLAVPALVLAFNAEDKASDVKTIVAERDIRFIRFWFTDILGQLKSFSINAAELDDAFEAGMGFDGSSITGFNAIEESDMIAMPDAATFAVLPWRPEEQGVGRMFCDVITPERTPYDGDPRHGLRRALERARGMGFETFNVGPELEYYLFKDSRS